MASDVPMSPELEQIDDEIHDIFRALPGLLRETSYHPTWEPFADALANAPNPDALLRMRALGEGHLAQVLLARDTRLTGEGVNAVIGAVALDMGILTTPQLHWIVRSKNKGLKASEMDYFTQVIDSYRFLVPKDKGADVMNNRLIVDGANGIGGLKLEEIKAKISGLDIDVRNSGKGEGILNERCGADFVQKDKVVPIGFGLEDVGFRSTSFDGDADRLVYFRIVSSTDTRIDLVDAYANGASTDFLENLGLEVVFTPTGVKYLHKIALEYDIGIYFEANGHGTVLFSDHFVSRLGSFTSESSRSNRYRYN
ncbi:hypothetical protein ABZP36_000687 [Zizania latifolia]